MVKMAVGRFDQSHKGWAEIIRNITSPIGIIALTLLLLCSMLSMVIIYSDFSPERKWQGFCMVFWLIVCTFLVFAILVFFRAKYLVYSERGYIEESKHKTEIEKMKIIKSSKESDITHKSKVALYSKESKPKKTEEEYE